MLKILLRRELADSLLNQQEEEMKKLAFSLIACLAFTQSTYAATSALTESLLEYEAITSTIGTNPNFQDIISPNEFIIDIKRITRRIDITGLVKYAIVTRVIDGAGDQSSSERRKHRHHHNNTYVATLDVSPNPGIGPNIVTVLSITQRHRQMNTYFDTDLPDNSN